MAATLLGVSSLSSDIWLNLFKQYILINLQNTVPVAYCTALLAELIFFRLFCKVQRYNRPLWDLLTVGVSSDCMH